MMLHICLCFRFSLPTRLIFKNYIFHYNHAEKENNGHVTGGVPILLSPEHVEAWKYAELLLPTQVETYDFCEIFIGTCLKIKKINSRNKKIKETRKFLSCSTHHPADDKEHDFLIKLHHTACKIHQEMLM